MKSDPIISGSKITTFFRISKENRRLFNKYYMPECRKNEAVSVNLWGCSLSLKGAFGDFS